MDNKLPQRKHPRLDNFDYSKNGYYFVTICSKNRKQIFSHISERPDIQMPYIKRENIYVLLTDIGEIAAKYILSIKSAYKGVSIDSFVIMPDHIHLIVKIIKEDHFPTDKSLTDIISAFKSLSSREAGFSLWQTSFYEHIIRNYEDLCETRKYIRDNPLKWCYEHN